MGLALVLGAVWLIFSPPWLTEIVALILCVGALAYAVKDLPRLRAHLLRHALDPRDLAFFAIGLHALSAAVQI